MKLDIEKHRQASYDFSRTINYVVAVLHSYLCCFQFANITSTELTIEQSFSKLPAFELELMPPLLSPSVCLHPGNSLGPTPCRFYKVTSRISEKLNFFTALTICMNNSCWHQRASRSITQLFSNQPCTIVQSTFFMLILLKSLFRCATTITQMLITTPASLNSSSVGK